MMNGLSVLVSGSGIAGSALSCLLARKGFRTTVVERSRELRSSGTPVDVQNEAFDVASQMGIVSKLRESATRVDRIVFIDKNLRRTVMKLQVNSTRQIELPRSDLARIMFEAARDDAEFIFNDSIVRIDQDAGGVHVEFETGPRRRFDLVIGCDGLHSVVRHLVFGPEERFSSKLGLFVSTFLLDETLDVNIKRDEVLMYNVPNRAVSIHPGSTRSMAAFMFRAPPGVTNAFDHRDTVKHRKIINDAYQGAGWRSDEMLDRFAGVSDFYFDAVSRISLPSWSKGRVALLGDAASCVSFLGGGSSNAIAGAATLANALSATPDDYNGAFRRYEETQRKLVDPKVRGVGLQSHFLIPSTNVGIAIRDFGVRVANFRHNLL